MVSNEGLMPVTGHGWRIGLNNMMRKEFKRRWDIRSILVQSAVWLFLLNLVLALVLESESGKSIFMGTYTFTFLTGLLAPIGAVFSIHGSIINEIKSGTAAWVLSKPASRTAFIISKLLVYGGGFLAIVILLQGIIAYAQISIFQGMMLPVIGFLGGLTVLSLNVIFYMALTVMLSTMFRKRVPIIGIPVALIIVQAFVLGLLGTEVAPWLPYLFPGSLGDIARQIILQSPVHAEWLMAIFISAGLSVLFIYLAIWRFRREEF